MSIYDDLDDWDIFAPKKGVQSKLDKYLNSENSVGLDAGEDEINGADEFESMDMDELIKHIPTMTPELQSKYISKYANSYEFDDLSNQDYIVDRDSKRAEMEEMNRLRGEEEEDVRDLRAENDLYQEKVADDMIQEGIEAQNIREREEAEFEQDAPQRKLNEREANERLERALIASPNLTEEETLHFQRMEQHMSEEIHEAEVRYIRERNERIHREQELIENGHRMLAELHKARSKREHDNDSE